jgi:hypothetical protein
MHFIGSQQFCIYLRICLCWPSSLKYLACSSFLMIMSGILGDIICTIRVLCIFSHHAHWYPDFTQLTWCLLYQSELFNLCGVSCVWHTMSILTSMCSIRISWRSRILDITPFMLYILRKLPSLYLVVFSVLRHLNLHSGITGCSKYFDLAYISVQQLLQFLILVQFLHAKFQFSHPDTVYTC